MAEMKEKADEIEDAIKYFEKAADLYAGEEVKTTGNNCNLKVPRAEAMSRQLGYLHASPRVVEQKARHVTCLRACLLDRAAPRRLPPSQPSWRTTPRRSLSSRRWRRRLSTTTCSAIQ